MKEDQRKLTIVQSLVLVINVIGGITSKRKCGLCECRAIHITTRAGRSSEAPTTTSTPKIGGACPKSSSSTDKSSTRSHPSRCRKSLNLTRPKPRHRHSSSQRPSQNHPSDLLQVKFYTPVPRTTSSSENKLPRTHSKLSIVIYFLSSLGCGVQRNRMALVMVTIEHL